jgi:hypothetical protein
MKKNIILLSLAFFAASASGPVYAKKQPKLTPMELQAIQSKEFQTSKEALFASTMSVFQDLGYTINSAEMQTGFITANSPMANKTNFWGAMAGVASQGMTKATAFIESMPNGYSRIRLNFVNSVQSSSAYGRNSQADKPILDAAPYRAAWEKIDEALFVRNALAAPAPVQTAPAAPAQAVPTAPENAQVPTPQN